MEQISVRPFDSIEKIIDTHGDMLLRICLVMLGNHSDAEDAVQETLIKYIQKSPVFKNGEHEKAWLITVASNKCRDMLRLKKHRSCVDIDSIKEYSEQREESGILEALMLLPEKFRIVMILYYVEQYHTDEIAEIIGRTPSAVKMRLKKGRKLLEEIYRKEAL